MIDLSGLEAWFVTGSQHLYGQETLKAVEQHSLTIGAALSESPSIPVKIVAKPVVTTGESIERLCWDANSSRTCIGLITWMHTFSPARMWIAGLRSLAKPHLHLHTQFNEELPWTTIDMDFMNLNQSAHGDREFGFMVSRMRLPRKVVVGSWRDPNIHLELATWTRAACAWHDAQHLRIARLGDNMRNVAVTEGDKVEAQIRLRYAVNGYGIGELVERMGKVNDRDVGKLAAEYDQTYALAEPLRPNGAKRKALLEAARIELGLRHFLADTGANAFTDTFEDLNGVPQLPGIAVQRLMADGYGFAAEGDWKTAGLVRAMKVMSQGLQGGTSFMEDYTYHLKDGGQVLGAHMLEICPSIAADKPSAEIHPLSIGGKGDPVRLVFTASPGRAVNASIVDVGSRFRLVVNEVNLVKPAEPLPKLPVARAIWVPEPNLKMAATAWILAGASHHTGLSQTLTTEHLRDFAETAGMECLVIDRDTKIPDFMNALKWNDAYYHLAGGLH
jgi:L-arabinose isomerase